MHNFYLIVHSLHRFNGFKDDIFGYQFTDAVPPIPNKRGYGADSGSHKRVKRTNFAEDQFDILEGFGDIISNTLAINGKACMQRLICEVSEVPVNELSFMGRILHEVIM